MPCEEFQSIEYSLLTDSLSTALQLIGAPKQCKHARLQEKVIRELNTIELGLNKQLKLDKKIYFMWVSTENMPADINSKSPKTFKQSALWINGPALLLQSTTIKNQETWGTFYNSTFSKTDTFLHWNINNVQPQVSITPPPKCTEIVLKKT